MATCCPSPSSNDPWKIQQVTLVLLHTFDSICPLCSLPPSLFLLDGFTSRANCPSKQPLHGLEEFLGPDGILLWSLWRNNFGCNNGPLTRWPRGGVFYCLAS